MKTIVSTNGQIVIPSELRERDGILPGQHFDIERLDAGEYVLKRQSAMDNAGFVNWLLACPDKGWFEPIPSESTDSL